MTEAEAKTRLCHRTLSVMQLTTATTTGSPCIGSACMAWRPLPGENDRIHRQQGINSAPEEGDCMLLIPRGTDQ